MLIFGICTHTIHGNIKYSGLYKLVNESFRLGQKWITLAINRLEGRRR